MIRHCGVRPRSPLAASAFACGLIACPASPASAAFTVIDDLEARSPGDLDNQGAWHADGAAYLVVDDPADPSNQVLMATVSSDEAYHPVGIANDTSATAFFRMRIGDQQNFSLGFSDHAAPTEINDYSVELNMANSAPDLRVNDGGSYSMATTLTPDRWYNVWLAIDNAADRFDLYLHDRGNAPALATDRVAQDITFRDTTAGELRSLFIKTGGGNSLLQGPLYLDDFYIATDPGLDLTNPIPAPGSGTSLSVLGWRTVRRPSRRGRALKPS